MIDNSLGYTISIFGWWLPENHDLYTINLRSVTKITVSDLVKDLENSYICAGVKPIERCQDVLPHVIPKPPGDALFEDPGPSFPHEKFWRTRNCAVLLEEKDLQCDSCSRYSHHAQLAQSAKKINQHTLILTFLKHHQIGSSWHCRCRGWSVQNWKATEGNAD